MTESLIERELLRARWRRAREPLNLLDPTTEDFATGALGARFDTDACVRLLILPGDPEAAIVEFDEETWAWWLEERDDPVTGGTMDWTRGRDHRPTSEAMVRFNWFSDKETWSRFLALRRDGGLEMGLASDVTWQEEDTGYFLLIRIVGRVWAALDLYGHVLEGLGDIGPWEVTLAMKGTEGTYLANVGEGWAEPRGFRGRDQPTCPEPALLTRREIHQWPRGEGVRDVALRLGGWIEDCWGMQRRRFLANRGELTGQFDVRKYTWH